MSHTELEASYARAVMRLLIGNCRLASTVVITGGDQLDDRNREKVARHAINLNVDLLHLAFSSEREGALDDISLFLPRDGRCELHDGCRLWLPLGGRRAVIVPRPRTSWHFRLTASEVVQIEHRPVPGRRGGILRAEECLARLVAADSGTFGDTDCHVFAEAA